MNVLRTTIALISVTQVLISAGALRASDAQRPNVVLIMTDNHAPWTLGCYGNPEIETPYIDQLAREGTLFTRAFSNNAVCSPTRASFLTGLMPSQHGVHRYLGAGGAQVGPGAYCTIAEFRTLPKILSEAGYVCGLSGKWHLGDNLHPQEGFSYWITKPHGHTPGFYGQQVIEDQQVRTEPGYLTDLWTRHGVEFIQQNHDRPFFLFLSYNGPYGLAGAMLEPIKNRHAQRYGDAPMDSFPRHEPHPWLHSQRNLINNVQAMRKYAAETSAVDDGVGQIMQTLRDQGLLDNTLVIFTADQGLAAGHSGFWGMGDHTRPLTAYDPMMQIPMILRYPKQIAAGQRNHALVSNYDLLPSVMDLLSIDGRFPVQPQLPGRSFVPLLRGESVDWEDAVFFEFENVRAVRTDRWKYIERIHQQPNELYDLQRDPGEQNNLYGQPAVADIQQQLQQRLEQFFHRHADPQWDLWHGGKSKSSLLTAQLFGFQTPLREGRPAAKAPAAEAGAAAVEHPESEASRRTSGKASPSGSDNRNAAEQSDRGGAAEQRIQRGAASDAARQSGAAVRPDSDGIFTLSAATAELEGSTLKVNRQQAAIGWWRNAQDRATWMLADVPPGRYDVRLTWAVPDELAHQKFVIELDDKKPVIDAFTTGTSAWNKYLTGTFGQVELTDRQHRLTFRPGGTVRGSDLLDLRAIELVPHGRQRTTTFRPQVFQVPDGYTVELAAAPPLLHHPMMACLDDRGRLFIAESSGMNAKADELLRLRPHQILMLEDTDRDGRYDRRTVFADALVLPNGACWHDGALYVCSAPYLWRFEDTDGDGQADRQEKIQGKFGFNGMSSAFHGPVAAPDGRLYWCGGQHGWTFSDTSDGLDFAGPWTSRAPGVFSCWPDGSDPRVIGHGALANCVEVTHTAEGEVIGTAAVYKRLRGQRHDAVLHWVDGAIFNLPADRLATVKRTGDILPELSERGHVAPSGLTRLRSNALGDDYQHDLMVTEFNSHKLYRLKLDRDGATFRSADEVFFSSDSSQVHLTDVMEDADGSLLVIDTGGWFLYGCPTSQLAQPEILGAIYRVRRADAAVTPDPWGREIDWQQADPQRLAAALDDPRFAVRDRAIAQLATRGEAALPALQQVLADGTAQARRNAVWAANRIEGPAARAVARLALDDADASVRFAAARSASLRRDGASLQRLSQIVLDDAPEVRRQAAEALASIGDPAANDALLRSLAVGGDRFLEHALIHALITIDDPKSTEPGLQSPSPAVRRAALVALDQMDHGDLTRDQVTPLLDTSDLALQQATLEVIERHPGWSAEIVQLLRDWLAQPALPASRLAMVRGSLLAFGQQPMIQQLMVDAWSQPTVSTATRMMLLEVISRTQGAADIPLYTPLVQQALQSGDQSVLRQAIATVTAIGPAPFAAQLRQIADSPQRSADVRVAALRGLTSGGGSLSDAQLELLAGQLDADNGPVDRLVAAETLGQATLTAAQLQRLLELVAAAGPLELSPLLVPFENAPAADAELGMRLVDAIDRAPGAASIAAGRLETLMAAYPVAARTAAQPLMARLNVGREQQIERLQQLQPALAGGDPEAGRRVFAGQKASCAACHRAGDQPGGEIGPNLSKIGEIRAPADLLESIVFPNASLSRGFESHTVLTDAGEVLSGVVERETADAIYLRTAARAEVRVERSRIEQLVPSPVSIMPTGLDQTLSLSELRDLVAYLASLR